MLTKYSRKGMTSADEIPLTVSNQDFLHGGNDDDFRRLVHSLLSFSARLQEVRNTFGAYLGLSGTQYTILTSIAHLGCAMGVGVIQVANHLGLSAAFITAEAKKLEQSGLIEKHTNLSDRRRVLMKVTSEGISQLASLAPIQRPTNDALFKALTNEDFDHLLRLCDGLMAGAKEAESLVKHLVLAQQKVAQHEPD